jgi:hypothetical protein
MTPTDHPSEEDLSALLDGEPGAAAHVETCAACQTRVGQLRAAAVAVGAPVAIPKRATRDAAIARAVAEVIASPRRSRSRQGWMPGIRGSLLAGGAAFTAVAAAIVFFVFAGSTHHPSSNQALLRQKAGEPAATSTSGGLAYAVGGLPNGRTESAARSATAGAGALPTPPSLATDLGDVPDGDALRARVGPAVHRSGTREQRAAGTAAASGGGSASGGTPSPMAAPAAPPQDSSASSGDVPPPYSGPPPPCEAAARSAGPTKDRLIYAANAKWQDKTPAVVLAFVPEPPAAGPVRVYVMDEASCRVLFSDVYDQ